MTIKNTAEGFTAMSTDNDEQTTQQAQILKTYIDAAGNGLRLLCDHLPGLEDQRGIKLEAVSHGRTHKTLWLLSDRTFLLSTYVDDKNAKPAVYEKILAEDAVALFDVDTCVNRLIDATEASLKRNREINQRVRAALEKLASAA